MCHARAWKGTEIPHGAKTRLERTWGIAGLDRVAIFSTYILKLEGMSSFTLNKTWDEWLEMINQVYQKSFSTPDHGINSPKESLYSVFIFLWPNLCVLKALARFYNSLQVPTMKHPFLRCKLLYHCVSCCPLDLLAPLVATLKTWSGPTKSWTWRTKVLIARPVSNICRLQQALFLHDMVSDVEN